MGGFLVATEARKVDVLVALAEEHKVLQARTQGADGITRITSLPLPSSLSSATFGVTSFTEGLGCCPRGLRKAPPSSRVTIYLISYPIIERVHLSWWPKQMCAN